jgi:multisubunit Na+/H+ antiporter MnhG subunit
MKGLKYGLFAIVIALAVVGELWLGVPIATIAVLGLVLVCPLMMLFMMRGMHNRGRDQNKYKTNDTERYYPLKHTPGL